MKTQIKKRFLKGAAASAFAAVLIVPLSVSAVTEDTIINANLNSVISITTSGTVDINIIPTSAGAMSSASDTVTVDTNDENGFTMTLANIDTDTDLENGTDVIPAHSGTQASPTTLANNTWGYRVDGIGGFGAGPTSAETDVASSAYSWAGVPSSASPNTIKTTATTAAGDTTTVWYGTMADTTNPSGTYTDTVVYSAVTN